MAERPTSLSLVLAAVRDGEDGAAERLHALVESELRRMAHARMRRERPGHVLQTTAIVHEAWLRLAGDGQAAAHGRGYFFAAAGRAMRRVLVDQARRDRAEKRGGDRLRVSLSEIGTPPVSLDALALHRALERLESLEPRQARVAELRGLVGLTVTETAEALGVSPRTVDADWRIARAFLRRELSAGPGRDDGS